MDSPDTSINLDAFDLTLAEVSGYINLTATTGKLILNGVTHGLVVNGSVTVEEGTNFSGSYFHNGVLKLNKLVEQIDHLVVLQANITNYPNTDQFVYWDTTLNVLKRRDATTVSPVNGSKIHFLALDVPTADVDLSAYDKLKITQDPAITIPNGTYNLLFGDDCELSLTVTDMDKIGLGSANYGYINGYVIENSKIPSYKKMEAITSDRVLGVTDVFWDKTYTNEGATGPVEITLPPLMPNMKINFIKIADYEFKAKCSGSDTMREQGTGVMFDTQYEVVRIFGSTNTWINSGGVPGGILQGTNWYGDGSDGDADFDGSAVSGFTLNDSVYSVTSMEDGPMKVLNFSSLIIRNGYTLTVSDRCRGLLVYVQTSCTLEGTGKISMTGRGAKGDPDTLFGVAPGGLIIRRYKTGSTDSDSTANPLLGCGADAENSESVYQNATFSNGKTYVVARIGKNGGAGNDVDGTTSTANGSPGEDGANLFSQMETGGGGGGADNYGSGFAHPGDGKNGTCFSGGSGGGGAGGHNSNSTGQTATIDGGPGGNGEGYDNKGAGGGAGNPGGTGGTNRGNAGEDGTGGLLMLFVGGILAVNTSASIEANGKIGGDALTGGDGGSSGGGNTLVLCNEKGTGSNEPIVGTNIFADGGAAMNLGGKGGDGSAILDTID